jgi:peptide/nickel transport system substrate-binding protein
MRRFGWRSVAVSSVIIGTFAAKAETRPQYGGTLHIAMQAAPTALDPKDTDSAGGAQPDSSSQRSLDMLIFDTLVNIDENLQIQPALATAWQALPGNQRWQLRIRRGVKFHDGTLLSAEVAAASLRAANPTWKVSAEGESVIISRDMADLELLAQLALPRNAIVKRNSDGMPSGTGPFHIVDWRPGRSLALAADEDCWRGRPFLDAIEVDMGRSFHEQMTAMELGKADLVEVAAEQAHRISQEGHRLASSKPIELVALLFSRDATSPEEKLLREALALSIERSSIRSVLLQGAGEPTASILPNWMSGYGFVFSSDADLVRARQAREQVNKIPSWSVGYDGGDVVARLLAERIALNAKDAGLSLQPTASSVADLRLVRIPLASPDPWIALQEVATIEGASPAREGGSLEDLYESERALLTSQRLVPLFHLPVSYAASTTLNNWRLRADGGWSVADAWMGSAHHER